MSRNAFEIRLETLRLAQDILSENMQNEHDRYRDSLKHISEEATSYSQAPEGSSPPKGYTVDDVLVKAKELYAFVAPPEGKVA
jgi:hypothetical protein